jgi:hypothetical protein
MAKVHIHRELQNLQISTILQGSIYVYHLCKNGRVEWGATAYYLPVTQRTIPPSDFQEPVCHGHLQQAIHVQEEAHTEEGAH